MATVNLVRIAHILTALDLSRSSKMPQIKSKAAIPFEELLFRGRIVVTSFTLLALESYSQQCDRRCFMQQLSQCLNLLRGPN